MKFEKRKNGQHLEIRPYELSHRDKRIREKVAIWDSQMDGFFFKRATVRSEQRGKNRRTLLK